MKKTRGFTLVELIVVMIILAILAALLIPSLVKYFDKAESTSVVAEARSVYIAAQAAVSEQYGKNKNYSGAITKTINGKKVGATTSYYLRMVQKNYFAGLTPYDNKYDGSINQNTPASDVLAKNVDKAIAANVLTYLDSADKNSAVYNYQSMAANASSNPGGKTVDEFTELSNGAPGVVITYDINGKIGFVEYGCKGWLVRIENGEITTTKNGKFTKVS